MWNGASSYKILKEHGGDDFIPNIWSFLLRKKILFKILYLKDLK